MSDTSGRATRVAATALPCPGLARVAVLLALLAPGVALAQGGQGGGGQGGGGQGGGAASDGSTASPVSPGVPPAASDAQGAPPEVIKPRTAGPGDAASGVIRPGPSGDAGIHVPAPSSGTFPTPVVRPQDLHGGTVVPK